MEKYFFEKWGKKSGIFQGVGQKKTINFFPTVLRAKNVLGSVFLAKTLKQAIFKFFIFLNNWGKNFPILTPSGVIPGPDFGATYTNLKKLFFIQDLFRTMAKCPNSNFDFGSKKFHRRFRFFSSKKPTFIPRITPPALLFHYL